jgi:hypothetical protein
MFANTNLRYLLTKRVLGSWLFNNTLRYASTYKNKQNPKFSQGTWRDRKVGMIGKMHREDPRLSPNIKQEIDSKMPTFTEKMAEKNGPRNPKILT